MALELLKSEAIYDAVLCEDWFKAFPAELATSLGARSCNIFWSFEDGCGEFLAHSGYYPDAELENYALNFTETDLWAKRALCPDRVNRVQNCVELVPDSEYEQSAFYNEWIRQMGDDTYHCMGMMIKSRWGVGLLGLHRGKSQKAFDENDTRSLSELGKHIKFMLSVKGKLLASDHRASFSRQLLDNMDDPILIVREDGFLIEGNASADRLLMRGDAFVVRRGYLQTREDRDARCFRAAIAGAAKSSGPEASAFPVSLGNGTCLQVVAMGVQVGTGRRRVALFVGLPDVGSGVKQRLQAAYSLTKSEADVASRLAEGAGLEQIARERGVAIGTVRAQLKMIFDKLQCNRQTEVVAVVRGFPPVSL